PAFLLNNEIDKGFAYIEQAHETAPFLASTNFNYNRAILDYRNHTYTGEYLQKASRINDKKIGIFADENNAFFGNDLPPARRYFLGDFSPRAFHNSFTEFFGNTARRHSRVWSHRFFNIPPLFTILINLALLVISLVYIISSSHKRNTVGECRLCGKRTCRKCREGEYCMDCKHTLKSISNASLVDGMKIKISVHKRIVRRLFGVSMNVLIPGSETFFIKDKPYTRKFPYIFITIFIYSLYQFIYTTDLTLFSNTNTTIKLILISVLAIYNIIFLFNFIVCLKYEINTGRA
ncbi:MAG: hypothetical protein ACQEQ4_09400, partial [Fibrobacterota bacterium]